MSSIQSQKKRIIFINPPPDYDKNLDKKIDMSVGVGAPLGVLMLATVLKNNGYPTRILDGQICDCMQELVNELRNGSILCVAFSVMSSQYANAKELSDVVKKYQRDLPVVWGGFHPTIFPDTTITNGFIDYLIVGEGDRSILQFCNYLCGYTGIDNVGNVVYKKDGKILKTYTNELSDFNSIPDLDWQLLDNTEIYIRKKNVLNEETRFMTILAGLGCNFKCSFCVNAILGKKHRVRPASKIVEEMNRLHDLYGIVEFGFVDENFFGDKVRLQELITLLEKNPVQYRWTTTLRANFVNDTYLNDQMLSRVARTGGYYFGVGAESGDEEILKKISKGIRVEHLLNLARVTRNHNITIAYSFIAGIPGEDCSMSLKTFRLIEEIRRINPDSLIIGPQVFRPYPGSPLYLEAIRDGLREPQNWNDAKDFLNTLSQFKKIDIKDIPWHKEPVKFKYMQLSFFVLLINKQKNPLTNTLLSLFRIISWVRLKTGCYSWFIEKPFLDYLNNRLT